MPLDLRLEYAIRYALAVFVGYIAAAVFYVFVAVFLDRMDDYFYFDHAIDFALLAMIVFFFAASAVFGSALAAVIAPGVVAKRMYWFVSLLVGWAIATVTIILLMFADDGLGSTFGIMLATALAAGLAGLALHVAAMFTGLMRKWFPRGMCQRCGYDLRHTSDQGTCPDCGAAAEKPFSS